MKRVKLLIMTALWLTTTIASATISNGVRQQPEPTATQGFAVSPSTDTYYYLYNLGAKAFFTEGNAYGTQASLDAYGLKVAFTKDTENEGAYIFNDYSWGFGEWKIVFFDNKQEMYVDWNNQPNYRWGVQQNGKTFRLYASDKGNPGWDNGWWNHQDCYEANRYVGLDASQDDTALDPFLDASANHYIDWAFVTEEVYTAYENQMGVFEIAQKLYNVINEAKQKGIDVQAWQSIYLNESATIQQLMEAITATNQAIANWEKNQAANATVAKPYDLTSKIVNPTFEGDDITTGWRGSGFGSYNPVENAERYNVNYDTYQTITDLPAGIYSVGVKAFYRAGNADEAYNHFKADDEAAHAAKVYATCGATTCEESIVSPFAPKNTERQYVGDESSVYDSEQGVTYYVPNNMICGEYYMHALGYYDNHVLVPVDESGELTIGVRKSLYTNGDWSLFDDFTLTYYGNGDDAKALFASENMLASSLTLSATKTTLDVGESVQITATVSPANTKNKKLQWTSNKVQVVSVNDQGVAVAEGPGTAVITATTTDGSNISRTITITVREGEIDTKAFVINEIMASNIDQFISPAFNFDGWIELYNPTNSNATLVGLYLSDEASNLTKWKMPASVGYIPAKGYKVIWFDSNDIAPQNAPFKLDTDGGTIYLSTAGGTLIASQTYPAGKERVSYARMTDGSETWSETSAPTPEASNATSKYASTQLAAPVVDQPSQLFTGTLSVNVTIPSGCTLRYTTDGSLPTLDNGQTSLNGQFKVDYTTCYRFRLFSDAMLASPVTTRSYIYKDRDFYLPVVSVVGDDDFFNSKEIGVFKQGPNGRPGNGQSGNCNWNMNWERPVNFSYLDTDGEMVLNQDVDLEMCGGWSRAWTPHSFKLKGTKEMGGNKNLSYPFFSQKPFIRNRTLQIRNGGNDTSCRFKDASLAYLVQTSGIDVDVQAYQPAHEFINGEYIGVLNVREPNNKHYVYANYGWDDDEIDQWEMSPDSGYVQKCGTPDVYNELCDVLSPDAANPETYQEICRLLDIDEFTNYMAIQFYYGGSDWPRNNVKSFRLRDGGKFRFVLFDVDAAFDYGTDVFNQFMKKEIWTFDELYPRGLGSITDQIRMVTLFKNLLQNADFRRKFIDAYCLVAGSVFEVSRIQTILDELYERVEPAMQLEGRSAYSTYNTVRSKLSSRLSTATQAIKSFSSFGLSSVSPQSVTLGSDTEGALLMVNGQVVPTGSFTGNLFAPVKLKAVAPAGYAFQGWKSNASISQTIVATGSKWTYYDQGSLDGKNWTSPSYSTTGWQTGNAPLGYGKDGIVTTLDYGTDSSKKRPTSYFRTTFNLTQAPKASDSFTFNFTVDDGIIVYVNGTEAGRYNMPSGTVSYSSYASSYAPNNPDTGTMELSGSLFRKGSNTIAVELHNNSASSTDLYWDAELTAMLNDPDASYYSTEAEIALPSGKVSLTASYRALTQSELTAQGITPVRINEISGSNSSLINEYFKKNDWIELYNTTDKAVDVEGMYLTDNLDKPTKYQITKGTTKANTVIPAHGYLIIWCDKLETTDQALHASFKIDGEGGVLQLMAADKSWKDEIYYGTHDANQTVGRYPDGSADVYMLTTQTIAKANVMTSYMTLTDQEKMKEATDVPSLIASANGFRVRYGAQQLIVKHDDAQEATVEVFTTDGRQLLRQPVTLRGGKTQLSIAHLRPGFYVARATDRDGNRVSCKFMK